MSTVTVTPTLDDALFEEDLSMMEAMLDKFQEQTNRSQLDEYMVRKMIIKTKILKEEIAKKVSLRDRIVSDWNNQIQKLQTEIDQINGLVEHFIKESNKGQKLQLDVATVSLRTVKPDIVIENELEFKEYLKDIGLYDQYLKEPVFDKTQAKNAFLTKQDEWLDQLVEDQVKAEEEVAGKKVTKKRIDQIRIEIYKNHVDQLKDTTPPGTIYKPESKSLSIRMNN